MIARETLEKLNVWDILVRVSVEKDSIEDEAMLLVVKCGKNRFKPFGEFQFNLRCALTLPLDTFRLFRENYLLYDYVPGWEEDYSADEDDLENKSYYSFRRATLVERCLFAHELREQYGVAEQTYTFGRAMNIPSDIVNLDKDWLFGGNKDFPNTPFVVDVKHKGLE